MFDFSDYYDVGDYLVQIPIEANIRSGISRYCYSGFCSVRKYLVETMGETEFLRKFEIHKRVCDRLINSSDNTESSIGEKLSFLKDLRNEADYNWNLPENYFKNQIGIVQKDSRLILQQIEALKSSPPFSL